MKASHYGVTEILADGRRLSVHVHRNDKQRSAASKKFDVPLDAEDSLAAAVLRLGHAIVVSDLTAGEHRDDEIQALGLQAAVVVPLASHAYSYGALAVYHESEKTFDVEQVAFLEALAHLVTGALGRCRAESVAQEKERFEQALNESSESMLIVLTGEGDVVNTNHACRAVTGFDANDLTGRSLWSALMLPEEVSVVKRAIARVLREHTTEHFETYILTSDGLRRRIAWTATPLAEKGTKQHGAILATGIDITDRCEAVERAARAEAMAHDARRLCNELQERIKLGEAMFDGIAQGRRLPVGIEHDRRARARKSYPYLQRIAPMRGSTMPDDSQFNEWMCYDISSRGFSFLAPNQPDYHKIVVAFGAPPSLVYLTAEVRHATRYEQNGRTQYIVGCRYTGRVTKKERAKSER
jgi:PAS domain S-box-containing protein